MLKEDSSEDGAAAQQQGQHAHEHHQAVKELPRVAFRWKEDRRQGSTKHDGIDPAPTPLTVSGHVGVFTLLDGGQVVETDPNFAAVCFIVHENLTKNTHTYKQVKLVL